MLSFKNAYKLFFNCLDENWVWKMLYKQQREYKDIFPPENLTFKCQRERELKFFYMSQAVSSGFLKF